MKREQDPSSRLKADGEMLVEPQRPEESVQPVWLTLLATGCTEGEALTTMLSQGVDLEECFRLGSEAARGIQDGPRLSAFLTGLGERRPDLAARILEGLCGHTVKGDVGLVGCWWINSFPGSFTIEKPGSLWLNECRNLSVIGEDLVAGSFLALDDCPKLQALPLRFNVEGPVSLRKTPAGNTIGNGFEAVGHGWKAAGYFTDHGDYTADGVPVAYDGDTEFDDVI